MEIPGVYQRVEHLMAAMLRVVLAPAVAVLLITLSAGSAHADPLTLYATTFTEDQLLQINLSTGAGTLIGVIPGVFFTADLASYAGNLYALDQSGANFDLINPATAAVISSTTLGVAIAGEGGFTFDTSGNAFVSASQLATGQLFECNVALNNSCSAIDGANTLNPSMDALAVTASNVLYGMSQSRVGNTNPSLYTINKTTGATTFIGSTAQTGNNLGGLAFDPLTGVLYSAFNGELYTVNTSTGAVTAVGAIGYTDISGLAFQGSATVPEPGTGTTFVVGMLALLSVAIARRATAAPRSL